MEPLYPQRKQAADAAAFVTLGGLPLHFELEWPFHRSTSGADWHVLHGKATLLRDPAAGLHAEFSANFTQTMAAALPSLEPKDAESVAINGVRVAADAGKLEFLKSGKRLPVEVSTRYVNFKSGAIQFVKASPNEIKSFLKKKIFWLVLRSGAPDAKLWIADPCDLQYLGTTREQMLELATALAREGFCRLEGELAAATTALQEEATQFESELQQTLDHAVATFNAAMRE
jgi:hypothetical protein